jgi:triphosphoribosyl-dephospho-CoA synthase
LSPRSPQGPHVRADAAPAPKAIAGAFEQACLDELASPKPGNVHLFAGGHRMTADDFARSAAAAAGPLTAKGATVGARILGAVEASFAAVGANTNLGIILLCAPIAAAAEAGGELRGCLGRILQRLGREDADLAFRAIARAAPAGLGRAARYDVFMPATVSLREAMAEAAERDRIALQYVTVFADIFEQGEPLFTSRLAATKDRKLATLALYLRFLAAFPDSHISRKYGPTVAREICTQAAPIEREVAAAAHLGEVLPTVLGWDAKLKEAGINPGTSADLTVASLFVHRLRSVLPPDANSD